MDIKAFLKQNALECENEKYVASDRFIDDLSLIHISEPTRPY